LSAEIMPFEYKVLTADNNLQCKCGMPAAYAIKRKGNIIKAEYFPVCGFCFGFLRWNAGGKAKETRSIISTYKN